MDQQQRPLPLRLVGGLWRGLTGFRHAAGNLLFLCLLVALLAGLLSGGPKVPASGALVVQIKGELVEQLTGMNPRNLVEQALGGSSDEQTLLKDQLDAIAKAKDDKRITTLLLDLSQMGPMQAGGMTKLEDLREALLDFRKSGKKVVAWADFYTQGPFYLAAAADEVWMHPFGEVAIEGLSRYRTYYKEALDRLLVDVHVFRVGEFKSAVEPYIRNDASPQAKEADSKWLGDLWGAWLRDVAEARKLPLAELRDYVDHEDLRADASKGDFARAALEAKLVDKLGHRDQLRARMLELAGPSTDREQKEKTFSQVSVHDYLEAQGGDRTGQRGGDAVAVVVAKGDILDGKQPAGTIGGDSTAALIRKAREDEKVKAIVLRVDSPGGSAFASEVIRRELVLSREKGKKVVVSMGTLAASGGYWISTASDEIWASPETITGSIGIFGMFPTVDRTMDHFLGLHVDGVGTTPLAGALRIDRPLNPAVGKMIQVAIEHGYEQFLAHVAEARKMSRDEVDQIARGRVWSGADAKERKLVDQLGGLPKAIASAARLAGLPEGHRVYWVEEEKTFSQKLVAQLNQGTALVGRVLGASAASSDLPRPSPLVGALTSELRGIGPLLRFNDPQHAYVYCPVDGAF